MKPSTRKYGITAICFLLASLFLIALPPEIPAQSPGGDLDELMDLEIDDIRSLLGEMILGAMDFSQAENEAFLPLHEKYKTEYNKLFDRMLAVIRDYQASRNDLDEKQSKELVERTFEIDKAKVQLSQKYYREFSRALNAKRAAQLFQILRRVDLLMSLKIASMVPVIGEDW